MSCPVHSTLMYASSTCLVLVHSTLMYTSSTCLVQYTAHFSHSLTQSLTHFTCPASSSIMLLAYTHQPFFSTSHAFHPPNIWYKSYPVTVLITFIIPVVIRFISPLYHLHCTFHLSHVMPILVILICIIIPYTITATPVLLPLLLSHSSRLIIIILRIHHTWDTPLMSLMAH